MKNIGVQKGLTEVTDYLRSQGYTVRDLGENIQNSASQWDDLDAIVVADYNNDMMGYSDTSTKLPIINASGLTAEDVKRQIDRQIVSK